MSNMPSISGIYTRLFVLICTENRQEITPGSFLEPTLKLTPSPITRLRRIPPDSVFVKKRSSSEMASEPSRPYFPPPPNAQTIFQPPPAQISPQAQMPPQPAHVDLKDPQIKSLEAKGAALAQQLLPPSVSQKLSKMPQMQQFTQSDLRNETPNPTAVVSAATPYTHVPPAQSFSGPSSHVCPPNASIPPEVPTKPSYSGSSLTNPPAQPTAPITIPAELHITSTSPNLLLSRGCFIITAPPNSLNDGPTILYTVNCPSSQPSNLVFHKGTPSSNAANEPIASVTKFHSTSSTIDLNIYGHPITLKKPTADSSGSNNSISSKWDKTRTMPSSYGLGTIEWRDTGGMAKHGGRLVGSVSGLHKGSDTSSDIGAHKDVSTHSVAVPPRSPTLDPQCGKKHSSQGPELEDVAWVNPREWSKKRHDATLTLSPELVAMQSPDNRNGNSNTIGNGSGNGSANLALDEVIVTAVTMMEALKRDGGLGPMKIIHTSMGAASVAGSVLTALPI